jgi:glycosyltransferase involved in cell wall biosynthesis
MNKISIALTNYNRTDLLFESIAQVINDERIDEIVISDDHSTDNIFDQVCEKYKDVEKVQIFRNTENLDCYRNKRQAVKRATNEYVILFDSDNVLTKEYIDRIYSGENGERIWSPSVLLAPSFAKPHFDFRELSGKLISKENVSSLLNVGNCSTMLNAMNYFVNREEFLRVWDGGIDPVTSDSLYQNYNWLSGGNSIYVVPHLEYTHLVHSGSHYQNNVRRTPSGFHDSIIEKLKLMK